MVSVVIVNYHTLDDVAQCVASIREHTEGVEYEVIVVDNASEENFEESVRLRCGADVRALPLDSNVGFGRANNAGFEAARGEKVFCLNPDTLLLNNAIKILSDFLDDNPEVGACGGNLYRKDMKPALSFRRILPGIFWEISESFRRHPERLIYGRNTRFNKGKRPFTVGYITGADLMMRREVVEQTGGFSPEFFMYFEETDLCRRIKLLGWKLMSVPAAKIQHLEGTSFPDEESRKRRIRLYEEGRNIYYRRNMKPFRIRICNFIYNLRNRS
ncbi:MAG: glycosyltransferase family 2 protein [Muribaculaceae bacterium]|nr:glycosyltransferase family 2 protein [Muribaculaceae bacterium]